MLKITVIAIGFLFLSSSIFAQSLKFGHVNTQDVLVLMPERAVAKDSLEKLQKQLFEEGEIMQVELNNRYVEYQKKVEENTLSKTARTMMEEELQRMQQSLANFETSAQAELRNAEEQLLKPIYDRLTNAIKEVGKENGFIYIFVIEIG